MNPDQSHEALAGLFANAITNPKKRAWLFDGSGPHGQNQNVDITEALTSGKSFAIYPREGIIACDIDGEAYYAWAGEVRKFCNENNCATVEYESSTPGHRHIWVIAPIPWTTKELQEKLKALPHYPKTAQTVVRKSATRTPYAPNKHGVRILLPNPRDELKKFERRPGFRPLEDATVREYRESLTHRYQRKGRHSRGDQINALIFKAILAEKNIEWIKRELVRHDNKPGSKYREHRSRDAWLQNLWDNASEKIRKDPLSVDPRKQETKERLLHLQATINSGDWHGRTGDSERRTYDALVTIGIKASTDVPTASSRQLADDTGLERRTVAKALKRLERRRLIDVQPAPRDQKSLAPAYFIRPESDASRTITYLHTQLVCNGASNTSFDDAFTNGSGLGLGAKDTLVSMPTDEWVTTRQVCELRPNGLALATVREHLKKLCSHGFVKRKGNSWLRIDTDEVFHAALAARLGVTGKLHRRRSRSEAERAVYRSRFGISTSPP